MKFLQLWFQTKAGWGHAALCLAIFLICLALFELRNRKLQGARTLDSRWGWYSPADITALFDSLGEKGRQLYAWTEVTLDYVFPLTYAVLFGTILTRLAEPWPAWYAWVMFVPIAAAIFDLLENTSIFALAKGYQTGRLAGWAGILPAFTLAKLALFLSSIALIGIVSVMRFF